MPPELQQVFERLVAANIELAPVAEFPGYFLFCRDGYVALVERKENGFGRMGAAGLFTGKTLAPLISVQGKWVFQAKGFLQEATEEQRNEVLAFSRDLQAALG